MFYSLGKIKPFMLGGYAKSLVTDEIIVTEERLLHIWENHPQDMELFVQYGKASVENPDMVIQDLSNEGTLFMIKKLPDTNLNVIVRLVLEGEDEKRKNSVMTFYRIRDKNLKKLLNKNKLLYSKK